jgi:ABC-type nitrate/sulfonate/bicarbonate transport system substrate-binding protein
MESALIPARNKPRPERRRWCALAIALTAGSTMLAAGCASSSGSSKGTAEMTKVTIADVSPSPSKAITYAAIAEGIFKKNHIDAELIDFTGGGQSPVAALSSGSVDVAMIGLPDVLSAVAKGALKGKYFYQYSGPLYDVVARKGINSVNQLKGGKIAVSATLSQDQVFFQGVLAKYGIGPNDVTFVNSGATLNRLALIKNGKVDAAAIAATQEPEIEKYGTILLHVNQAPNAFPTSFFFGTDAFLQGNSEAVSEFDTAISQSAKWLRDPKNKATYESICEKYASASKEACDEQLDYTMSHNDMWPEKGTIDLKSVQEGIDLTAQFAPEAKSLKASGLVLEPSAAP